MQRPSPSTLFEVAGLAPIATVEQVEARWLDVVEAADGELAAISAEVRSAFSVLRVPQNVELYRDLLKSAREETNIPIRDGEADTFVRFCALCLITPFQHPQQRELFAVCLPGQTVPPWVRYDPRTMSHLRMRWGQRLEQWIQRYLLGGVFRNRSTGQRLALGLAYVAVLGVAAAGGRSLVLALAPLAGSVGPQPTSRNAVDGGGFAKPEPTAQELATTCESVRAALRRVEEQVTIVAREFEQVATVTLADAASKKSSRSDAVELAIAHHASVKEAWSAILADRIDGSELEERCGALEAIEKRLTDTELRKTDSAAVAELETWTKAALERTRRQRSNIDHIRVMLEADRFERPLDTPDRSKP
ncbi:hypothetical protein RAS1_08770 [Phycisphaerae bacterium RAS1]|nr:hypothetical protein RAS1_08770 [Phycisphaerae bacterium RAS1]